MRTAGLDGQDLTIMGARHVSSPNSE